MIPILFESTATSFLNNGLGRLSDAISCKVTEERNGMYELEMDYPETGIHYSDIQLFRLIYAIPADGKSGQPFEIYDITKPLNGIVTVRAWHISYRLNRAVVNAFTAASCAAALSGLKGNSLTTSITDLFTFNTDKNVSAQFKVKYPEQIRSLLAGQAGSILDVYGKGEYEFDKFAVNLWANRGANNGVTIRYGKNLTAMTADTDIQPVYTGIVPYYYSEESGELVTLQSGTEWSTHRSDYPIDMAKAVDLSDHWPDSTPTKTQLKDAAQAYIESNEPWLLDTNLKVSFASLADTEEYKNVAALQRVNLCDTVTVIHEGLDVYTTAKVVTTVYDVLMERYSEIEIGSASSKSLGQVITEQIQEEVPTTSDMEQAIANGTALITGNSGGYVILKKNANGKPEELLILDSGSGGVLSQATNVWRFNSSGLGFSSNGYDGPYSSAWTIDGTFYANWITAGTMSANRVRTGTLTSYDGKVSIVLGDSGTSGKLIIDSTNFDLDENGNASITGDITANTGHIGGPNGLVVDTNKMYYSKSTLTSGQNGVYIGTDGISMGTVDGHFPLLWFDYSTGRVNCFRLDFITDSGNSWTTAHSFVIDDRKRITTGAGMNIGNQGYVTAGGENDTVIGNVTYANVQSNSDRRIKKNIRELSEQEAVDFIMGCEPVKFEYAGENYPPGIHHGLVAQDVLKIEGDWSVVGGSEDTMYAVGYTEMIADLIKTVQNQQRRIEALESALEER